MRACVVTTAAAESPALPRPTLRQALTEATEALSASGSGPHANVAIQAEQLYRAGSSKFSMLASLLERAKGHIGIVEGEWRGSVPKNGVLDIEWCLEFYRVWSAIQFSYCTPSINEKEFTPRCALAMVGGARYLACACPNARGTAPRVPAGRCAR